MRTYSWKSARSADAVVSDPAEPEDARELIGSRLRLGPDNGRNRHR